MTDKVALQEGGPILTQMFHFLWVYLLEIPFRLKSQPEYNACFTGQ